MQGIGYTFKVWLFGILLTPLIYDLLLIIFSSSLPSINSILTFAIPYTFLISVWIALAILGTIILAGTQSSIMLCLSFVGFLMPFAGLVMVHSISAFMSYGGGYLLALAYAISTLIFIWLFAPNLSHRELSPANVKKTITGAAIYALTVWLFTFLFSTPVGIITWIITKDYKPVSYIKIVLDVIERYHIQLTLSIAYFLTLFFTTLIAINMNINENKKKAMVLLFSFPLTFPVLFYYLLFSGELFAHQLLEILILIGPSIIVSALSIRSIDIIPKVKAGN